MEAKLNNARTMPDDALNDALQVHTADELDGLNLKIQRLARIQEYEEAAVSRSNPLAAVIGMGTASLQQIFEHLSEAILDKLEGATPTVADLRELAPEIHLLVKLRNSIETDLAFEAANLGQPVTALQPGMQGNPRALDAKAMRNKRSSLK